MTDFDSRTLALLDRAAPPGEREPNWNDVRHRAGEPVAARRRLWLHAAVPAAAAVAVAVLLAVAWPFRGPSSVIDQAIAAVGSGPVTHVVLEDKIGAALVDLRTGTRTLVNGRTETWYEPQRGLFQVTTFRRRPTMTVFLPASRGGAATMTYLQQFVTSYRAALKAGEFHVTGRGMVAGLPVFWISSRPQLSYSDEGARLVRVQQVAISRTTFKPVAMRETVNGVVQQGSSLRVLKTDTVSRLPARSARVTPMPRSSGYLVAPTSPRTTLAEVRASMHPQPVVPASRVAGLPRTWIGEPKYFIGGPGALVQVAGAELFYGRLDYDGAPDHRRPYVSITEFPRANPVVTFMGLSYFPADGHAVLVGQRLTLETRGVYIVVDASSPDNAIAAGRALLGR